MYIVSDVVQVGAVWPLHLAFDILLQEGVGLYRIWTYIVIYLVQ